MDGCGGNKYGYPAFIGPGLFYARVFAFYYCLVVDVVGVNKLAATCSIYP